MMMNMLLRDIPLVADHAVPFVVHARPDPRPHRLAGTTRMRRGPDRVLLEDPVGTVWIRSVILKLDGGIGGVASLGPLLDQYWVTFAKGGAGACFTARDRERSPALLSSLERQQVRVPVGDDALDVVVTKPSAEEPTIAVLPYAGTFEDESFPGFGGAVAAIAAKAACAVVGELCRIERDARAPARRSGLADLLGLLGEGAGKVNQFLDAVELFSHL